MGCCCCCLSQPTLARVFLATCSSSSSSRSSGRSRSRSRFRCQGTTRLLEEVASCRRRRERGVWQKALNDFVSFFAFPCALLSPPFLVCGPHPPQVLIAAPSDAAVECVLWEGEGELQAGEPSDFWPKPKLNWANKSHSERKRKRKTDDKQQSAE